LSLLSSANNPRTRSDALISYIYIQAMWRVARDCVAVEKRGNKYVFIQGK
jgi:hypothetical protein